MTNENSTTSPAAPSLDPELAEVIRNLPAPLVTITPEMIPALRENQPGIDVTPEEYEAMGLTRRDILVPGYEGYEMTMTVIQRKDHTRPGPGVFHTHGGGMISGDRVSGIQQVLSWVVEHDAVVVSPEYRLAPDFPDPYPVEDCFAGLRWTHDNAATLLIDTERMLIAGTSAGGGLAAGTALLARDRGGPALIGQVLICPMIDDRDATVSSSQYEAPDTWSRGSNRTGWAALLGDRVGTDEVSIYAAPARARDLAGLPPAFIDVGSAEVFRDEDVAYASALWAAGVQAELHVWAGGFHGFDLLAADAKLSQQSRQARDAWVRRLLD